MKKYLSGTIAVIMAIGFSAFTIQQNAVIDDANEPVYRWHQYDPTGTLELFPVVIVEGTETYARQQFECPEGVNKKCARAYDLNNVATDEYIYKP